MSPLLNYFSNFFVGDKTCNFPRQQIVNCNLKVTCITTFGHIDRVQNAVKALPNEEFLQCPIRRSHLHLSIYVYLRSPIWAPKACVGQSKVLFH